MIYTSIIFTIGKMTKSKNLHNSKEMWKKIEEKNELTCRKCQQNKSLDNFYKRAYSYLMWEKECKDCHNERKRNEESKRITNNDLDWNINNKIDSIMRNALARNIEYNLTFEFLKKLYEKQEGLCYYTKRKMSFEINSLYVCSLDRIDRCVKNISMCIHYISS